MCLLHKWEKWSVPESKPWISVVFDDVTRRKILQVPTIKYVQNRSCVKCGKAERRFLNIERKGEKYE